MREVRCPTCRNLNPLPQGARAQDYACGACTQQLPPDKPLACPKCGATSEITYDGQPWQWACWSCRQLMGQPPPPPPTGSDGAAPLVGVLGGAALGARLGGPGGALIGALVGALIGQGVSPSPQALPAPIDPAIELAFWVWANYPNGYHALTHQRLQGLVYYCHGLTLAYQAEAPFSGTLFQPWNHGPVSPVLWEHFQHSAGDPLGPAPSRPYSRYERGLEALLLDVLTVYGALDPWSLQRQLSEEPPYRHAYAARQGAIDPDATRRHFERLYLTGSVIPPRYLFDRGSFDVDAIPTYAFRSIQELAQAMRQ